MTSAYDEWLLRMLLQHGEQPLPWDGNWRHRELLNRALTRKHVEFRVNGYSNAYLTEKARTHIMRSMSNGN